MLSRRGKWIIGLLLACLLLAIGASWYRGYTRDRQALAQAKLMLQTANRDVQFQAANTVLEFEPDNIEARLIRARENFRQGRYLQSRKDVQAIDDTATPEQSYEAATIGAQSILRIARSTIHQAPERGIDTIGSQITEWLAQVASYRQIISADHSKPVEPLVIRALEADTRAMYLRLVLKSISTQISQTRTAGSGQEVEALGVNVSDDQMELKLLDQEVGDLSEQAIRLDPAAQQPRVLLFKRYLRHGEIELARLSVDRLIQRKQIQTELAIDVARVLLNLEDRYYLHTTEFDIELAQKVLSLAPADAKDNVEYQFATAEVLLAKKQYKEADVLLQQALSNRAYVGHTHGVCLRGRALIGLGRAEDARLLLAKLNDRKPTWESKYVQALATIASRGQGLDLLRQAQDKAPESLLVRLAICESIINSGGYKVAEMDISQLAALAPMHPSVMQIRLDYAAGLGVRDIVNEYITNVFEKNVLKISEDDVTLLGHMMLDDVKAMQQQANAMLAQRPIDPLAMLASHLPNCPAIDRANAARFAVQAMYPLVNDDPLRNAEPPAFEAWERRRKANAMAAFGQHDNEASGQLMRSSLYLPWPYETTLSLLTAAGERWPLNPQIKQLAARVSLWLGRTDEARQWLAQLSPSDRGPLEHAMDAYLAGDDKALNQRLVSFSGSQNPSTAADTGSVTDASDPTWLLLGMLRSLKQRDMVATGLELEGIFKAHPRAEPGLLWVVRTLYFADELDELNRFLTRFEPVSPLLTQIARSRVLLATNKVAQSIEGISLAGVEALADTSIRWQQTEIEAIAANARDQSVVSLGMLETLSLSIRSLAPAIGVGQVELMIDAGRDGAAGSIIMQEIALPGLAPVWTDAYLARAMHFMDPHRVLRAVDRNLSEQPDDAVLLYYRARLLMKIGDAKLVEQAIGKLAAVRPNAPRTLMLEAQHAMDQARLDDARAILTKLIEQGGQSQRVAQTYMTQLADAQNLPVKTQEGAQ